jgi:hypothetical protein
MNAFGGAPMQILSDNELRVLVWVYLVIFSTYAAFCVYLMVVIL